MTVMKMRHINQKMQSSQDNMGNFEANVINGRQITWPLHTILHEDKRSVKFKPHGNRQEQHSFHHVRNTIMNYTFIPTVITMDKMGIIVFNSEIKHYSTDSLKLCAVASEEKIIAAFWDANSTIPAHCVPGSAAVTGNSYEAAVKVPCSFISHKSTCQASS
jgi:hypothetical protein